MFQRCLWILAENLLKLLQKQGKVYSKQLQATNSTLKLSKVMIYLMLNLRQTMINWSTRSFTTCLSCPSSSRSNLCVLSWPIFASMFDSLTTSMLGLSRHPRWQKPGYCFQIWSRECKKFLRIAPTSRSRSLMSIPRRSQLQLTRFSKKSRNKWLLLMMTFKKLIKMVLKNSLLP